MARTATMTLQTIWDCRWSRPGYRVIGVDEHRQPEKLWVCVRRGERVGRPKRNARTALTGRRRLCNTP
jgi:hypothetical protein